MSPEARLPATPPAARAPIWRDLAVGVVVALPVGLFLSQVDPASYRSGAAAIAFLVVIGLSMRWTIAAGAAPVLWLAIFAQITDDFSVRPTDRDVAGSVVVAVSLMVVVLALRRWEGDRRRARDAAQARLRNERRLQALVDLAHHLAAVGTRVELLAAVEHRAPLAAGSDGAILVAVTHDGESVEFPVVVGHDPAWFPPRRLRGSPADRSPAVDVLRTGRPFFCSSVAELLGAYPRLADYVQRARQQAWAALPLPEVGALVLTWRDEQVFSSAQCAFLETIANLFGAAAERIRSVEHTELLRFVGAFDAMLDGVGIHRAVRDASGRVVDLEVEYLNPASMHPGERRGDRIGRRMSEIWPESPTLSEYLRVLETGVPYVLEDADVSSLGGPYSDIETVSIRASRLDDDRIVVVIRDVSERGRLVRAIREANEMFAVAQELAHVGSWRYDFVHDRLDWSAELYRIVGVPEGSPPVRPVDGSLFGFEHPDDLGFVTTTIRKALETREPFTFEMRIIRQSDGDVRDVSTTGIMRFDPEGKLIGVLGATQDITERRRAQRLRRAALDALEREREVVAELQRVILPAELPVIDGAVLSAHYRAATLTNAVGGDWYDAFVTPDGRVVLAIGDVAGHGIECAALANQLRVSVRVRANDGMGPAAILARLDDELGDGFVTCWLATYDPSSRRLRVANAGHLPPMLSRCGGAHPVTARTSPPLGTQRGEVGPEEEVQLEPDDLLVLYTDGLVERRGEDLDVGLTRLQQAVPLLAATDDPAVAAVELFALDAADDVCVVTLRVR